MRPKIYLYGDSITEESFSDDGWGSNLANHFCRTADVVLRGYSWYNTRLALKVVDKIFPAPEIAAAAPLAVTVFFGANDAALPDRCCGFQHVPVDEYKQNLHHIVAFFKKQWPSTRVLLITPPPIDESARLREALIGSQSGLPERTNEAAGLYAKQCLNVASESGVSSIDIWTKMQLFPGWQTAYLRDGLHLSKEGNKILFEEVISRLRKDGVSLETLPPDLPLLSDIDPNNPLKSFDK